MKPVILSRRAEKESKKQHKARRRWVIERVHRWMNRFRRLLMRREKREDTYVVMFHFACGILTWRGRLSK